MSVNIKKYNKNKDDNKIDDVLSSRQIDVSSFERYITKKTSGINELYFKLKGSLSYKEFKKACLNISKNNQYIKSVIVNGNKNNFSACLVFNPTKISLKETLLYVVDMGYIPIPVNDKQDKTKYMNNGSLSSSKENVLFIFTELADVFMFFIKGIWHIFKFIIDGIDYIFRFIFKIIYYIFKFIIDFITDW